MSALRQVKNSPSAPIPYATDPDESGIRRVPTADDLPDFTEDLVDLSEIRKAAPPPVPPTALWGKADAGAKKVAKLTTLPKPPAAKKVEAVEEDEEYDDHAISLLDFDQIAKSCPPKLAGYVRENDAYPSVPGIPAYFYVSTPPPAPKKPFDVELAIHIAVVWIGALAGGLLALF